MFSGRATYDTGVFEGGREDISDLITLISPSETPLLDIIGTSDQPARNVLHEWMEDELNPNTIATSTALASTTALSSVQVHHNGDACTAYLQKGAVLRVQETGEYLQITDIVGNDIVFNRAVGGTSASSLGVNGTLFIISDAALEGADVDTDTSRPRSRKNNYTQIFKKDIIVSGTQQAISQIGVANEFEYQKQQRSREILRDLEKAVIQGRLTGNTIGSATAYRTMSGIWQMITTNAQSLGTLTESWLGNVLQDCWDQGGTPDLIIADSNWKRVIDNWNTTRQQVMQGTSADEVVKNRISVYDSTYGSQRVVMGRWMMSNSLLVLSTDRVKVVPLQGRSFSYEDVSRTGDSQKGMILGEYTLEVRGEQGMAKAFG